MDESADNQGENIMKSTGRNEPCPCGSGKKFKNCCLKKTSKPEHFIKRKLDSFNDRIIKDLLWHGKAVFGPEAFDEALSEFFGWPEEEEAEKIDLKSHEMLFFPWFLFKWRIESDDQDIDVSGPTDQSIVESYLQFHGRKLDPVERQYLEAFAKAPLSFLEITAVEPGESLCLHDLLIDRDYRVLEKSGSYSLHPGDVVFGSIVEAGGIGLLGALGMISFRPSAKVEILNIRKMMSMATADRITTETLEEYDIELRLLYLDLFTARTAMPSLRNTDGDKLSFHTLKYRISSPQKVFNALKELTNGFSSEAELLEDAQYDKNGELCRVEIPWLQPANPMHAGMENTIHGRLIIDGSKMTGEVNSAERAKRLRRIIKEKLPAEDAKYLTTVIQSTEALLQDTPPSAAASAEHEALMNHPEVQAKMDEMMRKHWEAWPDMELPALKGKTPRQAVRDEWGRQQVNALLEDAERDCRSGNNTSGSLKHLQKTRQLLGLETP
jgi:hypothetical protein